MYRAAGGVQGAAELVAENVVRAVLPRPALFCVVRWVDPAPGLGFRV